MATTRRITVGDMGFEVGDVLTHHGAFGAPRRKVRVLEITVPQFTPAYAVVMVLDHLGHASHRAIVNLSELTRQEI